MIARDSEDEQIINVINETRQQIKDVKNKLDKLRNFYTENKDKLDYELVKTFFDNTIFIQKYTTDIFSCYINDKNNYETFLSHYKHNCDYPTVNGFIAQQKGKENLKIICDEEEMKLIFKMGLLKQKLNYYENIIKKKIITHIITWLTTCLIFLIMAVIYIITVMISVFILNCIFFQFMNTAMMLNRVQCLH
jgi:hypothetical protein